MTYIHPCLKQLRYQKKLQVAHSNAHCSTVTTLWLSNAGPQLLPSLLPTYFTWLPISPLDAGHHNHDKHYSHSNPTPFSLSHRQARSLATQKTHKKKNKMMIPNTYRTNYASQPDSRGESKPVFFSFGWFCWMVLRCLEIS